VAVFLAGVCGAKEGKPDQADDGKIFDHAALVFTPPSGDRVSSRGFKNNIAARGVSRGALGFGSEGSGLGEA
jgi:hypothetical protein